MVVIPTTKLPPIESGDLLTRCEFERRYHASPNVKKAELNASLRRGLETTAHQEFVRRLILHEED